MQKYGVNHWQTYSPTVNWISVIFLMIVAQIIKLDKKQIDFVLALPQSVLDVPVYMELTNVMNPEGHGKDSSK